MRLFWRYDAPTTAFFILTLVSVGFLAFPVWNYMKFYLALWNFDYTIVKVAVDASEISESVIRVYVELRVINPTDYSGLELTSIACGLNYIDGSHRVWDTSLPGHFGGQWVWSNVWKLKAQTFSSLRVPLGAYANVSVPLTFVISSFSGTDLDQRNAAQFIGFLDSLLKSRPSQVDWRFSCRAVLSSFLSDFNVERNFEYATLLS